MLIFSANFRSWNNNINFKKKLTKNRTKLTADFTKNLKIYWSIISKLTRKIKNLRVIKTCTKTWKKKRYRLNNASKTWKKKSPNLKIPRKEWSSKSNKCKKISNFINLKVHHTAILRPELIIRLWTEPRNKF